MISSYDRLCTIKNILHYHAAFCLILKPIIPVYTIENVLHYHAASYWIIKPILPVHCTKYWSVFFFLFLFQFCKSEYSSAISFFVGNCLFAIFHVCLKVPFSKFQFVHCYLLFCQKKLCCQYTVGSAIINFFYLPLQMSAWRGFRW